MTDLQDIIFSHRLYHVIRSLLLMLSLSLTVISHCEIPIRPKYLLQDPPHQCLECSSCGSGTPAPHRLPPSCLPAGLVNPASPKKQISHETNNKLKLYEKQKLFPINFIPVFNATPRPLKFHLLFKFYLAFCASLRAAEILNYT